MRKLKTGEIFKAVRIIKQLNLKDSIKELAPSFELIAKAKAIEDDTEKGKLTTSIGFNISDVIFNVICECGDEKAEAYIYDFLSGPFEMETNEVKELDIDVLIENIKEMAQINDFETFFNSVLALIPKSN